MQAIEVSVSRYGDRRSYGLAVTKARAWREDNRRASNGDQTHRIAGLAMKQKPSVDFGGYWQRHINRDQQATTE